MSNIMTNENLSLFWINKKQIKLNSTSVLAIKEIL